MKKHIKEEIINFTKQVALKEVLIDGDSPNWILAPLKEEPHKDFPEYIKVFCGIHDWGVFRNVGEFVGTIKYWKGTNISFCLERELFYMTGGKQDNYTFSYQEATEEDYYLQVLKLANSYNKTYKMNIPLTKTLRRLNEYK